MPQRLSSETITFITQLCQISIALSIFFITHTIEFLYTSKVYYFNHDLIYIDLFSISSFILILIFMSSRCFKDPKTKILLVCMFSLIFCSLLIYIGGLFAIDPMNYFVTLEESWYKKSNLQNIKAFQGDFRCCDFQPSIIDSANECHHGFHTPCLRVLVKNKGNSIIITGICFIIQGLAHFFVAVSGLGFIFRYRELKSLQNPSSNQL